MHEMTPAEFKVVIAISRRTFGWHKDRDVISLSQLEEMTGLSRTSVQAGIMAGIERGMLERTRVGKQSYSYHLLVASDYQSTETTSSEKLPELVVSGYSELVVSDYTQKKELKELKKGKKEGESARANTPDPSLPPPDENPFGSIYREIFGRSLTPAELAYVAARVTDPHHWREVCEDWKVSGYKPTNLAGLVDRYRKPPDAPAGQRPYVAPRVPVGLPLDETEAEIKIRCAARKAELLKGLPSWA
jgi:phage replication O-like protein O